MAASVRCEGPGCEVDFEPKRSTARFHSATCRQRAARDRKAAAANAEAEQKTDTPGEHSLVRAVRKELEDAEAIDTVPGQLALQLARRIANPEESGITTMSKELRSLLAEAKAGTPTPEPGAGTPAAAEPEEDDEVTKARRAREQKLSQAAGRA